MLCQQHPQVTAVCGTVFFCHFSIWLVWGEITTTPLQLPPSHIDFTSRTTWKTNGLLTFSCLGTSFYKPGCCAESCKYRAPSLSCTHFFSGCVTSPKPGGERCLCTWSVWSLNAKGKKTIFFTNYTIRLSHGFPLSCHFVYILISNVTFNSYYTRHYNTNAFNMT